MSSQKIIRYLNIDLQNIKDNISSFDRIEKENISNGKLREVFHCSFKESVLIFDKAELIFFDGIPWVFTFIKKDSTMQEFEEITMGLVNSIGKDIKVLGSIKDTSPNLEEDCHFRFWAYNGEDEMTKDKGCEDGYTIAVLRYPKESNLEILRVQNLIDLSQNHDCRSIQK